VYWGGLEPAIALAQCGVIVVWCHPLLWSDRPMSANNGKYSVCMVTEISEIQSNYNGRLNDLNYDVDHGMNGEYYFYNIILTDFH
jgi:hypothetical protein